jgi:hypothetical protein
MRGVKLSPPKATRFINDLARQKNKLSLTGHFKDRLKERDLLMADLLYLLKHGFVHDEAEESSQSGLFKYAIEGTTPNSENRLLKAIIIPNIDGHIKIVTIMWKDE